MNGIDLNGIFERFAPDIEAVRERIKAAVSESGASDDTLRIAREYTENTGKMIRPLIMLICAGDVDGERREKLLWSAAALEILHTSTLVLDDVIDRADVRRGAPSAYAKYGGPVAICAGDWLLSESYDCLLTRGYDDVAHDLVRLTGSLCDGELIQDIYRHNVDVTEETYIRSIEGKTAAAFSVALEVASRIAGYDGATQKRYNDFGMTLGKMFQIRDDILDWTKTEDELGKPVGEDFKSGSYTLPAIHAFKNADVRRELLKYTDNSENISGADFEKVRRLVISSGGIDYAEHRLSELEAEALAALDTLSPNDAAPAFRSFVNMCRSY